MNTSSFQNSKCECLFEKKVNNSYEHLGSTISRKEKRQVDKGFLSNPNNRELRMIYDFYHLINIGINIS